MARTQELFYFTDPMCSWCYGFGPELQALLDDNGSLFSLKVIPGGLRPDETRPMPERMAREISNHWKHVQEASGLEFYFDFFKDHPGFVYNTTPSSKALNTVALMAPEKTFAYLKALQAAFYGKGQDPTMLDTFKNVAGEVGMDAEDFATRYQQTQTAEQTRTGFELAAQLGIMGYPTLCLRDENRLILIARGYLPGQALKDRVQVVLTDIRKRNLEMVQADADKGVAGDACSVDPDGQPEC